MTPERMAAIHAAAFVTQRPWNATEFRALLADPTTVVVSPSDACFALARIIAGEAELLTLATHPDQRRQGLARDCMQQILKASASAGSLRMFLEVDSTNRGAIALYKHIGFEQVGNRAKYYTHPDGTRADAIVMQIEPLIRA